jgi:TRAP-type transport system small permease protein
MQGLIDGFCHLLNGLMALLLALMVVLVFGNVVLRYGFNSGITVSEELSRWFFVWMIFLGAIVGVKEHGHLGTDMLISRLGKNGKRVCLVLSELSILYVTWLIFRGSLEQTRINWDVLAPASELSMAWVSGVGVVFAILSAPLLLRELWRAVSGQASEAEMVMVQESEDLAVVEALHLDQSQTYKKWGPAP